MKTAILLLSVSLLSITTKAQLPSFSIGLNFIVKQEQYSFNDPGGRLDQQPNDSDLHGFWGITGRWYSAPAWTTEIGLYGVSIGERSIDYTFPTPGERLRFKDGGERQPMLSLRQYYSPIRFDISAIQRITFGPYAGLTAMTHNTKSAGGLSRQYPAYSVDFGRNEREVIDSQITTTHPNAISGSAELGLHLNYFLKSRWHFRAQYGWFLGVNQTLRSEVTYRSSFEPNIANRAVITSNGSGPATSLMVAFMFGPPSPR
jgi:hypothetical protein